MAVSKNPVRGRSTGFRCNAEMMADLNVALARDGVSPRRRSRWICRAVHKLFERDPSLDTVGAGEDREKYPIYTILVVDPETDALIDRAFRILRTVDPRHEGVASSVVRAAIRMGITKTPLEPDESL
jgi:hypothetical protein